mmetsp:Transcript_82680/g.145824  ORF Transcript_82680/g.145824 Transcript_82680/m.145824 type:complete len:270 (-) Transcript_82680:1907-2716(-)
MHQLDSRRGVLRHKLQPEVPAAGSVKGGEMLGAGLGGAVEESITAAQVCPQGMPGTTAVLQLHSVLLTGPAAVSEVMTIREKAAEHTVLHVEHWHVLVQRNLHHPRWQGLQHALQLVNCKVVGSCHRGQTPTLSVPRSRQGVGHIQAEVPNTGYPHGREALHVVCIAYQKAIGVSICHWIHGPFFVRAGDTRPSDEATLRKVALPLGGGGLQLFGVLQIQVDALHEPRIAKGDQGVQLGHLPHQHVELGLVGRQRGAVPGGTGLLQQPR